MCARWQAGSLASTARDRHPRAGLRSDTPPSNSCASLAQHWWVGWRIELGVGDLYSDSRAARRAGLFQQDSRTPGLGCQWDQVVPFLIKRAKTGSRYFDGAFFELFDLLRGWLRAAVN